MKPKKFFDDNFLDFLLASNQNISALTLENLSINCECLLKLSLDSIEKFSLSCTQFEVKSCITDLI